MEMLTLEETKTWLREDSNDPQVLNLIELIMCVAEDYLKRATGRDFNPTHSLAKLYCLVLVADWYENRTLIGSKPSDKIRFILQSIVAQLQYGEEV